MLDRICLPPHVAEAVSELRHGTIRLRVPLDDDVIQVGAAGAPTRIGSIVVTKTPSALLVRRSDGKPLQARIVRDHDGCHPHRIAVFCDPVDRLTVRGAVRPDGGRMWWVPDGERICRCQDDLIALLGTIATFSAAKQRRQYAGSGAPR